MDNTRLVSIVTNIGLFYVFSYNIACYASSNSFETNTFTQIDFALAITASVISFLLILMMIREFRKGSNKKYSHDLRKKSDSFFIFALFWGMVSAALFCLHHANYNISTNITASTFLVMIFFLVLSRHYRHKSKQKVHSLTSIGTLLSLAELIGVAILYYRTAVDSTSLTFFNHETTFMSVLLGVGLFGVIVIIVKDAFDLPMSRTISRGGDIPQSYPYKISASLARKAMKEYSSKNTAFINQANQFYSQYIKNSKNFNPNLVEQIKNIYATYLMLDYNNNADNILNVASHLKEEARAAYDKYINEDEPKYLMKSLKKAYKAIIILVNQNTRMRFNKDVENYSHYCWLVFPCIGMTLGGLGGYGAQQLSTDHALFIIAGGMVGWLIGYSIGEAIFCDKFFNCCKPYMEELNQKCHCSV